MFRQFLGHPEPCIDPALEGRWREGMQHRNKRTIRPLGLWTALRAETWGLGVPQLSRCFKARRVPSGILSKCAQGGTGPGLPDHAQLRVCALLSHLVITHLPRSRRAAATWGPHPFCLLRSPCMPRCQPSGGHSMGQGGWVPSRAVFVAAFRNHCLRLTVFIYLGSGKGGW